MAPRLASRPGAPAGPRREAGEGAWGPGAWGGGRRRGRGGVRASTSGARGGPRGIAAWRGAGDAPAVGRASAGRIRARAGREVGRPVAGLEIAQQGAAPAAGEPRGKRRRVRSGRAPAATSGAGPRAPLLGGEGKRPWRLWLRRGRPVEGRADVTIGRPA